MFIPVVKPEIGLSLEHELKDQEDALYVKEKLEQINKDNPSIAVFIKQFMGKTEDPIGAALCGIVVYRMIESQAEANWMLENLG